MVAFLVRKYLSFYTFSSCYLKWDGGVGLYEKVAVMFLCLRVDSNLELSGVVTVSFIKVRSGQIGWSLHLALAHILHSCGQIIFVALIVLQNITEYNRI